MHAPNNYRFLTKEGGSLYSVISLYINLDIEQIFSEGRKKNGSLLRVPFCIDKVAGTYQKTGLPAFFLASGQAGLKVQSQCHLKSRRRLKTPSAF